MIVKDEEDKEVKKYIFHKQIDAVMVKGNDVIIKIMEKMHKLIWDPYI